MKINWAFIIISIIITPLLSYALYITQSADLLNCIMTGLIASLVVFIMYEFQFVSFANLFVGIYREIKRK